MSGIHNASAKSCKDPKRTYVNPFVHRLELDNPIDKIKTYIFTVILLPFRAICICSFLVIAWLFACIGLYGLSPDDLKREPISGWRKVMKILAALSMRALFFAGSFNYIKYKGTQASVKEAPILCVAPHSTYVDSVVAVVLGPPSIVAKAETSKLPFFGKLIDFTQSIYVLREDPNSRQHTIKEIIKRANSKEDWPQVVIFPEGTCTNRSALITFKPGAFYPGVPVQPVLLRYPNELDTYTWTWEGPGLLKLLWLTLTKIHSACEIEFLPVYNPSEEEKGNPKLYAKNVRDVMARALGVPVSDFTYDDCIIMTKAKDMHIPHAADIVEIERLRKLLCLKGVGNEETLLSKCNAIDEFLDFKDFCEKLKCPADDVIAKQLFHVLDESNSGKINLGNYLLCALFLIKQNEPLVEFLSCAAQIYGLSNRSISCEELYAILRLTGRISRNESNLIYSQVSNRNTKRITFDDIINFVHQKSEYSYMFSSDEKLKKN